MCCVGLITVNAMPLTLFDDEQYFKRIIEPYENTFNIRVNSTIIRERLDSCAEQMKVNLSNLLKDKMLCIKFDIASRMDKSILVINVQFIKNFQIHIFTIAMVELENRHTAPILNEEILKHFNTFGINAIQIYCSTTDDGANVVKTSELLQENEITDADEYEEIHNRLSSVLTVERCAENTLQLVAHQVYKTVTAEVAECRETTNFLRQIIRNGTFTENIPMPTLDNLTRWSSTFDMLTSLLNLIEFVKMYKIECEIKWDFIQNFVAAFKPVAECTKSLQTENYVIGDFYRDWLLCETKLETMPNNIFASALLQAMQLRNENFWYNNTFVAALYIDPRFNYMDSPFFNESRRKQAVSHLISTSRILTDLEGNTTFNAEPEVKQMELEFSPSSNDDFHLLEQKVNLLTQQSPQLPTNVQTIRQKLEGLSHKARMPFQTNILDYWNELKSDEPDLAKLAEVVLAVPCTQTSVERAFNALSLILNKHNSDLKAENINNLLFTRLNKDLLNNVNFSKCNFKP
ncbi:uncharacterized protein LOC118740200 [Rhagoletis pomonella]|uniref:uncharacterized protein LOC118740200 n=1 Tax=Rhagoletis pomonella TaxID=28610 RepID=UPI00177F5624|nr:uncharacterized protein LOC118740200 [Rhagoletis pomonella]